MRVIIAFMLSLNLVWGSFAQAQMASVYSKPVEKYTKAKALHTQKGSQAFVNAYSGTISKSDAAYVTSTIAKVSTLPTVAVTAKGFTMNLSGTVLNFDLSTMDEGYILLDGKRVKANFGGSIEEIATAIEQALKQSHPNQFDKKVVSNWFNHYVLREAHAGSGAIWAALAAIVGALVIKNVYDKSQTQKKQTVYETGKYIEEPSYASGGNFAKEESGQVVSDYGSVVGPHNPGGVIPQRSAAPSPRLPAPELAGPPANAEGEDDGDPAPAPAPKPAKPEERLTAAPKPADGPKVLPIPPAPEAPKPAAPAGVAADEFKSYELALCKSGDDSINKIMGGLIEGLQKDIKTYGSESGESGFALTRRAFTSQVLNKAKDLGSKADKAELYKSYVSFINKRFMPSPELDPAKPMTDEQVKTIAADLDKKGESAIDVFVEVEKGKSNFAVSFVKSVPKILFYPETNETSWVVDPSKAKQVLCK